MEDVEKLLDQGMKAEAPKANGKGERSENQGSDTRSHHSSRSHSRRHRSRSAEHDRRGDRDHERRRSREQRRHRSRDSRPEGDDRDRKRRRSRSSERERDREGIRDRDRDREREPDRDRRYRDHSRDRYRRDDYRDDRDSPRRRRYDDFDDRRHPPRGSPRYDRRTSPPAPARSESPQLTEEEHEMRSVFVSQLAARTGDRELTQFFEQNAGKVRDARVITDRVSRRSKGVGYVEFRELESVQKALALTGTKLLGLPIMVQYTEAEKNRQALAGTAPTYGAGASDPNAYARLYVGSLNFNLTDDDLRQVFQPFGHIEYVDLHRDQITGKSKGYAFVQFKNPQDARNAMEKMNNFVLAGRALRVEIKAQPPPHLLAGGGGGGGGGVYFGEDRLEEPMGGNLNQITRVELMHKLARTDQPASLSVTDMYRPNIPTAQSRSIVLKNMFNPEEETERGWDTELRDEVKSECESKYGPVVGIAVEKESSGGEIYITFDVIATAQNALSGLNGRWFGGRQITANFISDALVAAHGGK